ncbi:hypothetical protein IQ06DRAFT_307518 [Phaeosphaeriaceae sp. SRC1lsM3a]|nr:hypothetical protein IQ06DRAFT_307518 [Stagonospora sp. SRC1lsM3a]
MLGLLVLACLLALGMAFVVLLGYAMLSAFGFTSAGIRAGSCTSFWHSTQGNVEKGSWFALWQNIGTRIQPDTIPHAAIGITLGGTATSCPYGKEQYTSSTARCYGTFYCVVKGVCMCCKRV